MKSDHYIRQLDEAEGRREDADPRGRCPRCGCKRIIARGVAGEPMTVFEKPICPNCEEKKNGKTNQ